MARKKIESGFYRHYKGEMYAVFQWGKHTETGEEVVIYRSLRKKLTDPPFWVRPVAMFSEKVRVGKKLVPRFQLVLKFDILDFLRQEIESKFQNQPF